MLSLVVKAVARPRSLGLEMLARAVFIRSRPTSALKPAQVAHNGVKITFPFTMAAGAMIGGLVGNSVIKRAPPCRRQRHAVTASADRR
jgi:hypothetical protein